MSTCGLTLSQQHCWGFFGGGGAVKTPVGSEMVNVMLGAIPLGPQVYQTAPSAIFRSVTYSG